MKTEKIVLVGAGSAVFTTGLIADFIVDGKEREIRLVDINRENLDVAYNISRKMAQIKNAPLTIRKSLDRREMFRGADVITTTIAAGGRRAWENDVFIPRKYGISQPVGDTIMPGGISRALRLIPDMVDIANDASRIAPKALFFNYSNPMAAICRALRKATKTRAMGLCHGIQETQRFLADFMEVPAERCNFLYIGMNHLSWFLGFEIDGKNAWPAFRGKLSRLKKSGQFLKKYGDQQFSFELFETFGGYPSPGDRHVTEFFPYFFPQGRHYGKVLGRDRFSFENTIKRGDDEFRLMKDISLGKLPIPERMFHENPGEGEAFLLMLGALEKSSPGIFPVITANEGRVENLPAEFMLEGPVKISKKGFEPVKIGKVSSGIRAALSKPLLTVELMVEAALERSRSKFVQALIIDGAVRSVKDAGKMADELIKAQRKYLPKGW